MAETKEQLLEENDTLRARVRELETQLKSGPTGPRFFDRQTSDQLKDLPGEVIEQTSRFVRALTMAALESTRLSGEILTSFAAEVLERNQASGKTRARDLAMNLPRDVASAGVNALDRSLRTHRHVVERFSDSLRQPEPAKEPVKS